MNEFVVANVDPDMAEGTTHRVKENQVAGLKLFTVNDLGCCGLLGRASGEQEANRLFVHGANKATAIKASFCRVTAALIGDT